MDASSASTRHQMNCARAPPNLRTLHLLPSLLFTLRLPPPMHLLFGRATVNQGNTGHELAWPGFERDAKNRWTRHRGISFHGFWSWVFGGWVMGRGLEWYGRVFWGGGERSGPIGAAHPACDIARSGPADSLNHTFRASRTSRSIAPIIIVRHVALSLHRGRTGDAMCFFFDSCTVRVYNLHLTHSVVAFLTRSAIRNHADHEVHCKKLHDTATRCHATGKANCHATPDSAGNCRRSRLHREANPVVLSPIARPLQRGEVSPPRLGSAHFFVTSSQPRPPKKPRPDHPRTNTTQPLGHEHQHLSFQRKRPPS